MTTTATAPHRLAGLAAPASYLAAALAAVALPLFLVVVGGGTISEAATGPAFYAPALAMLGSTLALLVALVALFVARADELGSLGLAGFLGAFVGTSLGAGGAWSYVFVVPYLSANAPGLADESSGSVLVGFVLSYLLMGLGWLLFAVAHLRARLQPRWPVWIVVLGAVVTVLPMPSRTLVLTVGVACLAHFATREVPRGRA